MQQKLLVGKVTPTERDEIKHLFERKNGLIELVRVIDVNDKPDMYEKIIADMGETSSKFQQWWDNYSRKYDWNSEPDCSWEINFETCEIYLQKNT